MLLHLTLLPFLAHASWLPLPESELALRQESSSWSSNPTTWLDSSLPASERAASLLSQMTLAEKTAQLIQGDISNWLNTTSGAFNESGLVTNSDEKAGMFYVGYPISWEMLAENIKRGQDYAVNSTRLGIPAIVQSEGIHGFLIPNATIFNSPIAQASSWNRTAIKAMANQIATEARTLGVNQVFAPLADLARELRYGRVEETYGEDGYLAGEMALNYVQGVQALNVSAMVKHFAAYSLPEQGLNTGPVHLGPRELRTTWLPSYKKAIIDGGAWGVMSAYSSLDGVPQVADWEMLTSVLRNEWGYTGWVSSDAGGTDRLATAFGTCPLPLGKEGQNVTQGNECIVLNALPAGGDVEMGGGSYNYRSIPQLVDSGALNESVVDQAVSRLLQAKFEMGLFEQAYDIPDNSTWPDIINSDDAKDLARSLDRESIVLLKNDANILPISKDKKIALIGPMADFMNYGDYVPYKSQYRGVTPLAGIQAALGNSSNLVYEQGCERWSLDQSGFPAAIQAASSADVAIVMVGTWSRDQNELWEGLNATTGEHVDVNDLDLVGAMRPLVQAIVNTTVPTVVVFSSGKPVTEHWITNTSASLVQQFYPSEQGGNALADILFGDYSPSGRLSVSYPRSVGDLPVYYDHLKSGRTPPFDSGYIGADHQMYFGHQYVFGSPAPWYPFGYGLSYTTFDYSNVSLSSSNATETDTIKVSVEVTNNGTMTSAEVVQMYVEDVLASVDVPIMRLRGFEKIWLEVGETKMVEMDLCVKDLGVWNGQMEYVVEPGEFVVQVGGSSADFRGNASLWVS